MLPGIELMINAQKKTPALTYADYAKFPDDERWELIDGVAYAMSPAPNWRHQEIVLEIARQLGNQLLGKTCRAAIAPLDVRLPKAGEVDDLIDTVVQPDVMVVCDPSRIDLCGVRGAPTLVIEVLSPSTASHDHLRKRRVYERAGVAEFWLVHPIDGVVHVYRLQAAVFAPVAILDARRAIAVGALEGVAIDLSALFEGAPESDQ
jgi:Uma2 family endonuclease